jgi:hypothetical protein
MKVVVEQKEISHNFYKFIFLLSVDEKHNWRVTLQYFKNRIIFFAFLLWHV